MATSATKPTDPAAVAQPRHTPGPWRESKIVSGRIKREVDSSQIAMVSSRPDEREAESNVRLIAAAPDLLAALKGMVEEIDAECVCYEPGKRCSYHAALKLAEAALAKAEKGGG